MWTPNFDIRSFLLTILAAGVLTVSVPCGRAAAQGVDPVAVPESAVEPVSGTVAFPAPTRLHGEPRNVFMLLRMSGNFANFRYKPGSLDRSARLQARLNAVLRGYERWTGQKLEIEVFSVDREEWEVTGYPVPYGFPLRVGGRGLAAPAKGDPGTVELWSRLLAGNLPNVPGTPILGTREEMASLAVSDVFAQLLASEILVDTQGLAGDAHWVRGVAAHLATALAVSRIGTDRPEDVDTLYRVLATPRGPRAFAAEDYNADLALEDWLWFQAQYHVGARVLLEIEGKNSLKVLRKLAKKDDGILRGARLLAKYERLQEWYRASFSAVSMVP